MSLLTAADLVFSESLRARVRRNLEGFRREECPLDGRRAAAVALTLVAGADHTGCFVLTRRASRLRDHAGQWALPGGRLDANETPDEAALRELHEEVGLSLAPNAVLGRLDDYPTRSGFVITPVVVWGGAGAVLVPDPTEVAEVHRVPLEHLEREDLPHLRTIPESDRPVISIPLVDDHIHAPTAAMIYQLREVALHGRSTRVAHFEQPVWAWR
ncbi:MAG: CoA pyrophosphatase [Deltaproteobacteria bacterium]|nr:CoA pyrophosphatase [Deltaproteobacteria bacterium]